jgi:hypothetical protein
MMGDRPSFRPHCRCDHPPILQQIQHIGSFHCGMHVLLDQHYSEAVIHQLTDRLEQDSDHARRRPDRRFVEKEQLRRHPQRAGYRRQLALAVTSKRSTAELSSTSSSATPRRQATTGPSASRGLKSSETNRRATSGWGVEMVRLYH